MRRLESYQMRGVAMENERCDTCGRDDYRKPSVAVDAVALRECSGTEALLIGEVLSLGRAGGQVPRWLR